MPSLLLSPNTRTAFDAVRRHLREAQKENALALAWLIMPSPLMPVWRRSAGASVNVHTLALGAAGPDSVGHAILERTGNPALVLDGFQRRLLLREILAQAHRHSELQVLPDPAEKPGVIRHLDNLLQELKRQTISPSAFQIYADTSDSAREQDIAFAFRRYEETLSQKGMLDETGAMAVACQELETGAEPPLPLAYVGVVGYVAFTSLQIRLMQQLLPRARNACLLMPGTESSDSLRLAQDVAQALDLPLPCLAADIVATESLPGPAYVEAPTLEHEVRHVLRAVKRLHVEKRVAYSDVTLCLPAIDTYASLLHAVAEEYGLPLELPKTLAQNPLWVFWRQLLHLFPDFSWPHCWDVFASPFLRQPFLSPDEIATVRFMTSQCRVIQGREQWRAALSPAVRWSSAEKKRWPLAEESIQDLARKVERFLDALSPPARGSVLDYVAWVEQALSDTDEESIGLVVPPETPEASQSEIALVLMRQVAADLKSDLGIQSTLAWEDARTLILDAMAACEVALYKPNRAIRVVLFDQGWALPTRYLFVLGLNEGSLPRAPGTDPFYTPQERARHPLALERHAPARSRVQWAQLQANCQTQITLSRSALTASAPSPFWDASAQPISIGRDELPDFSRAASPAELLLALLHARAATVPSALQGTYVKAQQRARVIETRLAYDAPPGPFEGVLEAPDILGVLRRQFGSDYVWSPTSLQDYARCPMGFFARRVLQLEAEETAEPGLDQRDKGSILHEILHRLHQWLIEEQVALTPAHEDRILAEAIRISRAVWREAPLRFRFQPYSLSQFDLREIENLVAWCVRNEISEAATEPGWMPWRLEWRFTSLVEQGADCADEVFTLHGMVDRVDRNADGTLRVIDYKTRRNAYTASDLDSALANQTILYALAVSQQGWGSVRESGYRLLGRTEDARLQNAVDFRDTAAGKANILLALIRRQQARIRAGAFPNAPPKLEGQANRCVDWCSLSDFCQPSFVSRRKGQPLTD